MHWKLKFQTSRCLFKNRRRCLGGLLLKFDYRIRANKKKSREKGGLCLVTTRLLVTAEVYWTTNRNINCCYPAQSTILPSCLYYGCSWLGWISGSVSKLRFLEQERLLPSKESLYLTCPTVDFFYWKWKILWICASDLRELWTLPDLLKRLLCYLLFEF